MNGDVAPLRGLRVIDLSRLMPGPFCSWYLAALGADVVKVEPPTSPDPTRFMPPVREGLSTWFATLNRGKRSLALDIRRAEGRDALHALLQRADVLLEGFRPGVLAAGGLDPRHLLERHPRLIVASITGYGQDGPLAEEPGHDLNYLALAGVVAAQGPDDNPFPIQVADQAAGSLTAALRILAAVVARDRTGRGAWLDVSMTAGLLGLFGPHLTVAWSEGRELMPGGEPLAGGYGAYRTYTCADGLRLAVAPLEPKFWEALVVALRAAGVEGPLLPTAECLAATFASRPRDAWVEALPDTCVAPALTASEVRDHPQHRARNAFEQVGGLLMPRAPFPSPPSSPAPSLGQHTRQVLVEAGLDPEPLLDAGVAVQA